MDLKIKTKHMINRLITKNVLLASFIVLFVAGCAPGWDIDNPYESVDWTSHSRYKGNLHTHTTNSDGRSNPHQVVDTYHELGYDFLAITDHNAVTYPWTEFSDFEASSGSINRMESSPEQMPENLEYEDRDPAALGMIDIQGNELSRHHHTGSFFNDHNGTETVVESLEAIAAKDGIAMLYHPGRYQGRDPGQYKLEWYLDLYEQYDHLIGMEVYNQGDRYPQDRMLWDSVLTVLMPDRPVWGYSNDDMHHVSRLGRNWTVMILPELTHESVRKGMENGLSYFVYAPEGHYGPEPPVIQSINVNDRRGTIEITASDYDSVTWISQGNIVHTGNTVNLNELEETGNYIRAKIYGHGDIVVGTQPFGIR